MFALIPGGERRPLLVGGALDVTEGGTPSEMQVCEHERWRRTRVTPLLRSSFRVTVVAPVTFSLNRLPGNAPSLFQMN